MTEKYLVGRIKLIDIIDDDYVVLNIENVTELDADSEFEILTFGDSVEIYFHPN